MKVEILSDAQAVALRAADLVEQALASRPRPTLGLAAGATPALMYDELVRRKTDFSTVTLFGLDEYLGIGRDHPSSCAQALHRYLIDRIAVAPTQVHLLDGRTADVAAASAAHEAAIAAAGGLDLQLLGLGVNGHIGFNEPGCDFAGRTGPVALTEATRTVNRPNFPSDQQVPTGAVTMGVATIMAARRVLLLATGSAKAAMVARFVEGPVTPQVPASVLQRHADAVVLIDRAAAALLQRT
ncbi:Glucosamine-6-phosphate deaminase [Magnetospirillum sp. LM-5]|uniref:glucosamine-6-phosphate deaminase n=1 Tax=Magnetospirillum sp. LM-5 TaxID=2681466 RepID=UPI00137FFD14|nr:glucosamine-6-phosphate deaminase [Magnetospirillum sp. LM-5]CAA7612709.1 Glucosamine-6-phosphate deaminase [Magnetospirillum sp. LM-5]